MCEQQYVKVYSKDGKLSLEDSMQPTLFVAIAWQIEFFFPLSPYSIIKSLYNIVTLGISFSCYNSFIV